MMHTNEERVVLVDERNQVLGTSPKATVHTSETPLHRGFSVFLFNPNGMVLMQQRSSLKKTWPLVWSNSCCGHPALDETTEAAVRRRVAFELGITEIHNLTEALPNFRYSCVRDGVMENEICPVWIGTIDQDPKRNPDEVEATYWENWKSLSKLIAKKPGNFSQWCELEVLELNQFPQFSGLLQTLPATV
ncbi:isopentenyl-diphosphate Delta-isomerase [soil metagenome]